MRRKFSRHAMKLIKLIALHTRYEKPCDKRFRCTNRLYFDIFEMTISLERCGCYLHSYQKPE